MKKTGLLIVMFVSLISCSSDDSNNKADAVVTDYYGKWVQYTEAKYANDPSSKQYSYVFNKDNTFSKMRSYENINITLTGTFETIIKEDITRFVLTYKEKKENSFISNCTGSLIESFTLDKSGRLIDDARACDAAFVFKKAN
ncbi:hypothetical protein HYN56_17485 [Flavobacterium crocinum]|uniref:Lipocalin-like domain-containing protein n=1 Tax=Flavobacterium crocinum TaxID=2183896 RepID=A0A2S1YPB3_9FLAO|nr:hypothetical protein [Flavobacterium crocinum]AWK05919.1 hypothetical protein HYN56_17485 [Flavobacterium crocinum]